MIADPLPDARMFMKIVVLGATGRIGTAIVAEALQRRHTVTAAVRSKEKIREDTTGLRVVEAQIDDAESVAAAVQGHDAVIDSVGGLGHDNPRISIECMEPLTRGLREAGVDRLLVVGTAGTLLVEAGGMRKDQPGFPERLKEESQAQGEVLEYLSTLPSAVLRWTYFSPPIIIEPGERTGRIRLGGDRLLFDDDGRSYISYEDFALATIDELENPRNVGRQMTAVSY